MHNIKYIITYTATGKMSLESADISYSTTNPIVARRLAIKELIRIDVISQLQLTDSLPENPHGIGEWDCSSLVHQAPAMNSILRPFSVNLLLDLEGTEYVLYGGDTGDTLEALWAEAQTLKQYSLIDQSALTGVLQNLDYNPDAVQTEPPFLFCEGLSFVPDFKFKQFDIVKADSDFLLGC